MECLLSGHDRKFANCNGVLSRVYDYGMEDLLGARYNQQGDRKTSFVRHKKLRIMSVIHIYRIFDACVTYDITLPSMGLLMVLNGKKVYMALFYLGGLVS